MLPVACLSGVAGFVLGRLVLYLYKAPMTTVFDACTWPNRLGAGSLPTIDPVCAPPPCRTIRFRRMLNGNLQWMSPQVTCAFACPVFWRSGALVAWRQSRQP